MGRILFQPFPSLEIFIGYYQRIAVITQGFASCLPDPEMRYFLRSGRLPRMYSIDDLLHLASSDGADELRLHVGTPPVVVLGGEHHTIEGPPITTESAEQLLQSVATTR